jgi:hypothetical protein
VGADPVTQRIGNCCGALPRPADESVRTVPKALLRPVNA